MDLSHTHPNPISSYELVNRSLEDALNYDNLSDAEKSRSRKHHQKRRRKRARSIWFTTMHSVRNADMFWIITCISLAAFILVALSLLYYRHKHLVFLQRFDPREINRRREHLGFDHIYVIERPAEPNTLKWKTIESEIGIRIERWPVSAPRAIDTEQVSLVQRECWRPHAGIYKDIIENRFMDALIVEDHVLVGPSAALKLSSALRVIPGDWDLIQFGPELDALTTRAAHDEDSHRHAKVAIHGTNLFYKYVDSGHCNLLAYAVSRAGVKKVLAIAERSKAHADFEHSLTEAFSKSKFLAFRVTPSVFYWLGSDNGESNSTLDVADHAGDSKEL